jgi:threonine dehydratase
MSEHTAARRISPQAIAEARTRIRPEFLHSRQIQDEGLCRTLGTQLICKIETENAVASFKGRGCDSFIGSLPANVPDLVAASAGNFGLALAYAAKRRGIAVTIYAAETASPIKLDRMRAVGATVKLHGKDLDEAKDYARSLAAKTKAVFVEDGREPAITAGAGTIAMELTDSPGPIDRLVVPLGNGALLAGMGCWVRAHSPSARIVGVCAEGAPAMALSWRSHTVQSTDRVDTIADGIAVRVPVPEALVDMEHVVDDVVVVTDDAIRHALKLIHEHLRLTVEPASVSGVAAVLAHPSLRAGVICTVITGANVTPEQFQTWISECG